MIFPICMTKKTPRFFFNELRYIFKFTYNAKRNIYITRKKIKEIRNIEIFLYKCNRELETIYLKNINKSFSASLRLIQSAKTR